MKLSAKDMKKLEQAHPDLKRFVLACARETSYPFMVMEVGRSVAQQKKNIANGVSWTMHSRHILSKDGLARAADLVPIDEKGKPIWAWPVYNKMAVQFKAIAKALPQAIEWGGDWKSSKDGPHWQLPWKLYP